MKSIHFQGHNQEKMYFFNHCFTTCQHRGGVCIHMYVLNWLFVSMGVSFLMEIFGVVEGKRDEGNYF